MSQTVENAKAAVRNNIDTKTVVSVVAGIAFFGALVYGLNKLGKHGKQLAAIAKGGK